MILALALVMTAAPAVAYEKLELPQLTVPLKLSSRDSKPVKVPIEQAQKCLFEPAEKAEIKNFSSEACTDAVSSSGELRFKGGTFLVVHLHDMCTYPSEATWLISVGPHRERGRRGWLGRHDLRSGSDQGAQRRPGAV